MYKLQSIGTDPEVFLSEDNNIISAIGLIGGTKEKPLPVDGGALQEDNVLAEFNIMPATTPDQFVSNIRSVMEQLKAKVGPRRDLVIKSSHRFTADFLRQAGPQALQFGCDPDFNAHLLDINEAPNPFTTLRTAGGHVHACFNVQNQELDPYKAAIMMDFYLGIPSVILDGDNERRELYGKAGACRPKLVDAGDAYNGVEYRSLSNFWLKDDELIKWVFNNTSSAISNISNMKQFLSAVDSQEVQRIINTGDAQSASQIIDMLNIQMPEAA